MGFFSFAPWVGFTLFLGSLQRGLFLGCYRVGVSVEGERTRPQITINIQEREKTGMEAVWTRAPTHIRTPLLLQNCHRISPCHSHSHSSQAEPSNRNRLISSTTRLCMDLNKFIKILPTFHETHESLTF